VRTSLERLGVDSVDHVPRKKEEKKKKKREAWIRAYVVSNFDAARSLAAPRWRPARRREGEIEERRKKKKKEKGKALAHLQVAPRSGQSVPGRLEEEKKQEREERKKKKKCRWILSPFPSSLLYFPFSSALGLLLAD